VAGAMKSLRGETQASPLVLRGSQVRFSLGLVLRVAGFGGMRRRGGQDSKNGVTCVGSTAAYEYGGIKVSSSRELEAWPSSQPLLREGLNAEV